MKKALFHFLYITCIATISISLFLAVSRLKKGTALSRQNIAIKAETSFERPFVIAIPSYKNSNYCERNLASVFSQKYSNYRVIYVDDASPDDTYEKVKNYVTYQNQWHRFTLLKNDVNSGSMFNHLQMSQYYRSDEIVVMLDGDDFLASDTVLKELNSYYANPEVWATYGQHISFPDYKISRLEPQSFSTLKKKEIRELPWFTSALRTFYGGLFQRIKMEDCLYEGSFLPMASDVAYIYPILEMAREHTFCTKGVFYIYNRGTGLNDYQKSRPAQIFFESFVRSLPPYRKLLEHPSIPIKKQTEKGTSVVVFSLKEPKELKKTLASLERDTSLHKEIFVLFSPTSENEKEYDELKKEFSSISFIKEEGCSPSYQTILFLSEGSTISSSTHLDEAVEDLEKTGVSAYYLFLNSKDYPERKKVLPLPMVRQGLSAIALSSIERFDIERKGEHFATLYSKDFVIDWLKTLDKELLLDWKTRLFLHQLDKNILGLSLEFPSV